MKSEHLILVPDSANDFRATVGALRSLGKGENVSIHIIFLTLPTPAIKISRQDHV
jgi:hypothetical protein